MSFFKDFFAHAAATANAASAAFRAAYDASRIKVPPANNGPSTYPASKLTDDDKRYLMRMVTPYGDATHGSQIFFDILTDDAGKTWGDLGNDATAQGKAFKLQVNTVINYADRIPGAYSSKPITYSGPLVAIVGAAAAKHVR